MSIAAHSVLLVTVYGALQGAAPHGEAEVEPGRLLEGTAAELDDERFKDIYGREAERIG